MSVLTPMSMMPPGLLAQIRKEAANQVQGEVELAIRSQDLIYRDVTATDFNNGTNLGRLNNPVALVANTPAVDVFSTFTLASFQSLVLFGIALIGPAFAIDEIQLAVGVGSSQMLAKIPLDQLYAEQDTIGYFDPVVWNPLEHVAINMLSSAGALINTETFQFLGYMGEQRGRQVNPRSYPNPAIAAGRF